MRLGCLALFLAIAMLWGGLQGLYTYWSSGSERTISYQELLKERPSSAWIRLSDASWKLIDGVSISSNKQTKEDIYVPASPDRGGDDRTRVLVHLKNQRLAYQLAQLLALPQSKQIDIAQAEPDIFLSRHPIEGLIEFGIDSDDTERDALKNTAGLDLAKGYVVIDEGEKPDLSFSLVMSLIGLAAGYFAFIRFARTVRPAKS